MRGAAGGAGALHVWPSFVVHVHCRWRSCVGLVTRLLLRATGCVSWCAAMTGGRLGGPTPRAARVPMQHGPAGVAPPSVYASTSRQHPKGDNPPEGRQPVLHSRRHKPSVAGAQDGVNDKRGQKRNQGTDDKGEAAPPQPPRGQQGVIELEATRRCPPHETYNAGEAAAELTRTTPTRCAAPHRRHATRAAPFTRQSTPAATRLRQHLTYIESAHIHVAPVQWHRLARAARHAQNSDEEEGGALRPPPNPRQRTMKGCQPQNRRSTCTPRCRCRRRHHPAHRPRRRRQRHPHRGHRERPPAVEYLPHPHPGRRDQRSAQTLPPPTRPAPSCAAPPPVASPSPARPPRYVTRPRRDVTLVRLLLVGQHPAPSADHPPPPMAAPALVRDAPHGHTAESPDLPPPPSTPQCQSHTPTRNASTEHKKQSDAARGHHLSTSPRLPVRPPPRAPPSPARAPRPRPATGRKSRRSPPQTTCH